MNKIPDTVREYAKEDIDEALKYANKVSGVMKLKSLTYDCGEPDDSGDYTVYATAIILCPSLKLQFEFVVEYVISGDDVYVGGSVEELADSLSDRYDRCKSGEDGDSIQASSSTKRQRITAADDPDDDFSDTVDDLSDTVDDIQDTLDDIDEDDVDIELDNNIANHFIAECDSCHGIFISALVESDQEVDSINGTCPLCEKETEQYLKWVIKDR